MVSNIGQMGLIMRVNGIIIKLKAKGHFGMPKVIFTKVNLEMIWQMVMVNTHISMEVNIKENLKMTYKKVMAKKNGSMEPNMLVLMQME